MNGAQLLHRAQLLMGHRGCVGHRLDVAEAAEAFEDYVFAFGATLAAGFGVAFFHVGDEGFSLHGFGDGVAGEVHQGGGDVENVGAFEFAGEREVGRAEDEHSVLGVVAGVGAGVVFAEVDGGVADGADGAPTERAEVDDEVGGHVADFLIDLFRQEDERVERLAIGVGDGFEFGFKGSAEGVVFGGGDCALGLTALDVEEDAGVVAALGPDLGFGPVDVELVEGDNALWRLVEDEEAFVDEPLIDGEAAVEGLCAVVGDEKEDSIVVEDFEDFADLFVEPEIVVGDDLLVGVAGDVVDVARVEVVPEAVVDAVHADVDEVEVVPVLVFEEVMDDFPLLATHFEYLFFEALLVVGAEVGDVDGIVTAGDLDDLGFQLGGMGELVFGGVGSEEAADADAVDLARGEVGRDADDDGLFAFAGEVVPDGHGLDGGGVGELEISVAVVSAVAKAVDAEGTGILAGGHAGPGGNGDGRDGGLEAAVGSDFHEATNVDEARVVEDHIGRGTVKTENTDFHRSLLVGVAVGMGLNS